MAGTLPGVESARRRRFNHGASDHAASWIRKSSFRHEFCHSSSACAAHSSSLRGAWHVHEHGKDDEKLGGLAREAKERLDEKLRNQRTRPLTLNPSLVLKHEDVMRSKELKRSVSKMLMKMRLRWTTKLRWNLKASEQEECSICLERFKFCEPLARLPCAHRFHSRCLAPWIASNAHCPCCRMSLTSLTPSNAKTVCKF